MKKQIFLFTLILIFTSIIYAQEKEIKIEKTEKPKPAEEKIKLPTAKEVFENNVKATGERAAIEKVKSRSMTGAVELTAMGLKGNFEIISKSPNKSAAIINLNGFGEIVEAFDGTEAWTKNPLQGLRVKTGKELEEVKEYSALEFDYDLSKIYPKATVMGIEKIGDAEVYVVQANEDSTFYFDKKSGLMLRSKRNLTSPQGKITSVTTFEDYREVDGVKLPFKFIQNALGAELVFNVSELKQNVEMGDERFSKPK